MKKILLPIFGGFLLASSVGLTTGQNANLVVKQQEAQERKEQELLNAWHSINSQSNLNEAQIKTFQVASQSWDNKTIDNVLSQALQYDYDNNKLSIDSNKLDATKLPSVVLENINLALDNLNNAVALGLIKVNTTNNMVQLIYPNNNNINSDIIYFDSNSAVSTYSSSYMWYSTYGPSHWWKFWEWGGYVHFNELAVQNAKYVNIVATIANIFFLFRNIKQIVNTIDELSSAWNAGNTIKINDSMKKLANVLGGIDLTLLGEIVDILAIFTAIGAFILALISAPGVGALVVPFLELVASIIASVTSQMLRADRGYGVKWQWYNFIIPGGISAE